MDWGRLEFSERGKWGRLQIKKIELQILKERIYYLP
jgi:hypothetical protein